ncbi:MAG: hypothetical protein LBL20_03165, partial [Treponema sp.]|nr:hypothetical protein [Treponema sp.]
FFSRGYFRYGPPGCVGSPGKEIPAGLKGRSCSRKTCCAGCCGDISCHGDTSCYGELDKNAGFC